METKKTLYANRKKHYDNLLKKQNETISFISLLRFLVFASGLGFTIFFYLRTNYYLSTFCINCHSYHIYIFGN